MPSCTCMTRQNTCPHRQPAALNADCMTVGCCETLSGVPMLWRLRLQSCTILQCGMVDL